MDTWKGVLAVATIALILTASIYIVVTPDMKTIKGNVNYLEPKDDYNIVTFDSGEQVKIIFTDHYIDLTNNSVLLFNLYNFKYGYFSEFDDTWSVRSIVRLDQ
jgi:hypothetical protein